MKKIAITLFFIFFISANLFAQAWWYEYAIDFDTLFVDMPEGVTGDINKAEASTDSSSIFYMARFEPYGDYQPMILITFSDPDIVKCTDSTKTVDILMEVYCRQDAVSHAAGDTARLEFYLQSWFGTWGIGTGFIDTLHCFDDSWHLDSLYFPSICANGSGILLIIPLEINANKTVEIDYIRALYQDNYVYYAPPEGAETTRTINMMTLYTPPTTEIDMFSGDRDVLLEWDASISTDIDYYRIYWGVESGVYYRSYDVGKNTAWTLYGLHGDTTYYFAVTAIDSGDYESEFSNEEILAFDTDTTYWEGDLNFDGAVDATDKTIIQTNWYSTSTTYNIVGSTTIDVYDLAMLARNYNKTGYKSIIKGVD